MWTFFLVIGCMFLFTGISEQRKYSKAISLSELDADHYKYGDYIVSDISYFLKKEAGNYSSGNYTGICEEYITFGKSYDVYTVPIKNNAYVRIMAADSETKRLLESACKNENEIIHFEGKIIKPPLTINYKWYEEISDVNISSIVPDFVVQQTQVKNMLNMIYGGAAILIACIFALLTGITKDVVSITTPKSDIKYSSFSRAYNWENELQIELYKMKRLQQQLSTLKKHFFLCIPFYILGTSVLIKAYYWEIKIFGVLILVIAAKVTFQYFINLQNRVSLFFVRLFDLHSISVKINECQDNIEHIKSCMKKGKY